MILTLPVFPPLTLSTARNLIVYLASIETFERLTSQSCRCSINNIPLCPALRQAFLCDACSALFTEDLKWNASMYHLNLRHGDVRTLQDSAGRGCSLCLTILKGFPRRELAFAHAYLNLVSQDKTIEDAEAKGQFSKAPTRHGYSLHLFYLYLNPFRNLQHDLFCNRVDITPFEGESRFGNSFQPRPFLTGRYSSRMAATLKLPFFR